MDKIPGYSANASWAYSYRNSPSATSSSSNIRATASGSQCLGLSEQISELTQQIANRTRLSTTGYQMAMDRINNAHRLDANSLMTMRRAEQYTQAAKRAYPTETLKQLAALQQQYIYRTVSDELRGAIEMSPEQLTDCLQKCREHGFSNCDMQALEVGLHLRYGLGLTDFSIVSNHKLSHNYVVFPPNDTFPKGAIVDSWTGQGVVELNMKNKLKFMHHEGNYHINENMHNWLENNGSRYVLS